MVNNRFGWRIGSGNGGFPLPPLAPLSSGQLSQSAITLILLQSMRPIDLSVLFGALRSGKSGTVTQSPLERGTSLYLGRGLDTSLSCLPIHQFGKVSPFANLFTSVKPLAKFPPILISNDIDKSSVRTKHVTTKRMSTCSGFTQFPLWSDHFLETIN